MSRICAFACCSGLSLASELSFLVMGDWGGQDGAPFTTGPERDMAEAMNEAAARLDANFALALGDNFYHYGVKSVDDPRFETTFEQCFTGEALTDASNFTFHVIAGNHDHRGSVQAQIDYTAKSKRWNFPANYYSFSKTAPDGATVDFVMIDTILLAGNSQVDDENGTWTSLPGSHLPGPENEEAAQNQMDWIRETLEKSAADYIIVAGHYPVHSVAEHGPTKQMQAEPFPFLRDYRVSAYLCGHDHSGQHIDVGDGVQYHVIGSAHGGDAIWWHMGSVSKDQMKFRTAADGGFAIVSASKQGLRIQHADETGKILYEAPAIPSRHTLPPAPSRGKWECHANMKLKVGKDNNLFGKVNILDCEAACHAHENCKAILWHRWDKHCHVFSGDFSYDDFKNGLSNDDHARQPNTHDSCFFFSPSEALLV